MPTAIVELTRGGDYDVACFVPKREYLKVKNLGLGSVVEILPALPEGLYAFATPDTVQQPKCVSLRLAKDQSGTDVTPVLVAADYLREQGWDVELPRWATGEGR